MDELFRLRREQLRSSALTGIERRLSLAAKYGLLPVALLVAGLMRPGLIGNPLFRVYLGIFISGMALYTYLYRRLLSTHPVAIMTLGGCMETLCVSLIYCTIADERLAPIVFFFLSLFILRIIWFYPTVSEFSLVAGLSSVTFLFVVATLRTSQLFLPFFWLYFASMWLILGLGITVAAKLFAQFGQSVKNRQLILQALQMVSSLVEMAESTAHLHEKSEIFQRSVEIISRVMAVHSCVAWVYQDNMLCPVASAGLDSEQKNRFNIMKLSIQDIPMFSRALTQKVPIVAADDELGKILPLSYRRCFEVNSMLVIPLTDNQRILGCVALHWHVAPERITSQELAILSGIATQIGISLENVYLLEELREKEKIRGRLLERVISIQERERERIARELHDETGQILTALMVDIELLRTEPGLQSASSQERLAEVSSLLSKIMGDIHDLSLDLHPKILNELGLVPAIRWYMKNHLERWGIDFNVTASNLNHSLSAEQEICLFRVAQEAITNVVRHAQAQRIEVEISVDAESIYLGIRDDGKGFEVDPHCGVECLGLQSMKERVSFLDGEIDIASHLAAGTEVFVSIPLQTGRED